MLFSKEHPLMSFAATFDTHKFVRRLKGAGFNDEQAKVLTEAVFESQASADVATKGDLRAKADPVPCKNAEIVRCNKAQQPVHTEQRADKGGQQTNGEDSEIGGIHQTRHFE